MPLSYGQFEGVVVLASQIAEAKQQTFQSRVKQWQKMGFPREARVGRGVRAEYSAAHLFKVLIMMQMLQAGITPERAIKTVEAAWPEFKRGIVRAMYFLARRSSENVYALVRPTALRELMQIDDGMSGNINICTDTDFAMLHHGIGERPSIRLADWGVTEEQFVGAFRQSIEGALVIDLTLLSIRTLNALGDVAGTGAIEDLAEEVSTWRGQCGDRTIAGAADAWAKYVRETGEKLTERASTRPRAETYAHLLLGQEITDGDDPQA